MKRENNSEKSKNLFKYILLAIILLGLGAMIYSLVTGRHGEEEYQDIFSDIERSSKPLASVSPDTTGENETIRDMQRLILKKDQMIISLDSQVNAMKNQAFGQQSFSPTMLIPPAEQKSEQAVEQTADMIALTRENEDLQLQLREAEDKIPGLKYAITRLGKENEQLTARLNQGGSNADKNIDANTESLKRKNNQLEQELKDLTAQLGFEQIDCNLDRADVNRIISNSKQRKELLAAALQSLNALAKSTDPGVRDKAKEKFIRLQAITKTVRD